MVTVQRRGQNGYFALSIDGLVTMRRGSQDSTGGLDGRIGCNNWPPSSAKHGKHGRAWQHSASSRCRRRHSTVCHVSFWAQFLLPSAFGRCRKGYGGSTKGHCSGHYKGHYDQKRNDHDHDHDGHDAAARARGEPRVAVVTSDDEQCLLGAANGGLGSLRCICSTPTLHICHPTAPFAEPAVSSHGCDGGGDLPISARPALAAIVTRRVAPYKCKDPTTVWKLPPCALQSKKQLVILNRPRAATPIGSGHRANRRAWHQQRSPPPSHRLLVLLGLLASVAS